MDDRAKELLDYWLGIGPDGWYRVDKAVDDEISERWGKLWEQGRDGALTGWSSAAESCLALLILLDQFSRNMFRGDARAFAADARALEVAQTAILHRRDQRIALPQRQFFYLPLMHSEVQSTQDKSVRLFALNFGRGDSLRHAQAHREIIRRFGRFPYRNAALGRESSPDEGAFLQKGGYQKLLDTFAA